MPVALRTPTQQQQQQQLLCSGDVPFSFVIRKSTVVGLFPQILGGVFMALLAHPYPSCPALLRWDASLRGVPTMEESTRTENKVDLTSSTAWVESKSMEQQIRTKTNASKSLQGSRHVWCEKQLTQSINCTRFHQCLFECLCRLLCNENDSSF